MSGCTCERHGTCAWCVDNAPKRRERLAAYCRAYLDGDKLAPIQMYCFLEAVWHHFRREWEASLPKEASD
jgi:hypothetical protein